MSALALILVIVVGLWVNVEAIRIGDEQRRDA